MEQVGIKFTQLAPTVDEELLKKTAPVSLSDLPLYLAHKKAESLVVAHAQDIIIGCDQMGFLGAMPLGKPGTRAKAVEQLQRLQGQSHQLITALAVYHDGQWKFHTDTTTLRMKNLTDLQIQKYVDSEDATACAGGYKIESLGLALFEEIKTQDHTAIVGLPMMALCRMLEELGHAVL